MNYLIDLDSLVVVGRFDDLTAACHVADSLAVANVVVDGPGLAVSLRAKELMGLYNRYRGERTEIISTKHLKKEDLAKKVEEVISDTCPTVEVEQPPEPKKPAPKAPKRVSIKRQVKRLLVDEQQALTIEQMIEQLSTDRKRIINALWSLGQTKPQYALPGGPYKVQKDGDVYSVVIS